MSRKPTILVSGYGTWAKADTNPAAEVAGRLDPADFTSCTLVTVELPVHSADLMDTVGALLDEHKPDGWIGLGVSGAAVVQPEMIGINWRDFSVPDAAGEQPHAEPVLAGGPPAYNATLPCEDMAAAMRAAGIPSAISYSAGTHLCNQLIYTLAHLTEARGLNLLSGFVHVPQSPENIAQREGEAGLAPSMDLALSTRAIGICVEVLAAKLAA